MKKKTIAQQLNIKEFPFSIKDKNGNEIYCEIANGEWYRFEYDKKGRNVYYESSIGTVIDRVKDNVDDLMAFASGCIHEDIKKYIEEYHG